MGRKRQPLEATRKGGSEIVRFRHPLKLRTVVGTLGVGDAAIENLKQLNLIFLNPQNWLNIPTGVNERVRGIWLGAHAKRKPAAEDSETVSAMLYRAQSAELALAYEENSRLKRQVELLSGQPAREGPVPTLREAYDAFKLQYAGRDAEHTKNVMRDLRRFMKKFGETRDVDSFHGKEAELDTWLRDLKIVDLNKEGKPRRRHGQAVSAGRKHTIRIYILKLLAQAGVTLKRERVAPIKRKEIRKGRGPIRWLERDQAVSVADKLTQPWASMFRVQVGTGLRPSELITLKRSDFSPDFSELFLSPFDIHTLKTGTRHIQVPAEVRKIVKKQVENPVTPERKGRYRAYPPALEKPVELVFPNPNTGERWPSDRWFFKNFSKHVKAAALAAGIKMKVGARTGRTTCGSLLIRAGKSVAEVAAILGDDPDTVREHYARILSGEVNPSAAVI